MKKKNTKEQALATETALLPKAHFVDPYIKEPSNPVTVNLIGAGGTGSHVATVLGSLQIALMALDHPGLQVTAFDDDLVTPTNIGRQGFFESEVGLNKAVAIVTRINRSVGTQWKAVKTRWTRENSGRTGSYPQANITISCVDTPEARFDIAHLLKASGRGYGPHNPIYWIDFGNGRHTGQVLLSSVQEVKQPASKIYQGVSKLPFITDEFKTLLRSRKDKDEPSCSMAEALQKQGLFINRALAASGGMLIENLFRAVMVETRGFFLNLADFTQQPIRVG